MSLTPEEVEELNTPTEIPEQREAKINKVVKKREEKFVLAERIEMTNPDYKTIYDYRPIGEIIPEQATIFGKIDSVKNEFPTEEEAVRAARYIPDFCINNYVCPVKVYKRIVPVKKTTVKMTRG
jgi:CO dehydrogenase/acetyl-CoA synthase alpha subunit